MYADLPKKDVDPLDQMINRGSTMCIGEENTWTDGTWTPFPTPHGVGRSRPHSVIKAPAASRVPQKVIVTRYPKSSGRPVKRRPGRLPPQTWQRTSLSRGSARPELASLALTHPSNSRSVGADGRSDRPTERLQYPPDRRNLFVWFWLIRGIPLSSSPSLGKQSQHPPHSHDQSQCVRHWLEVADE